MEKILVAVTLLALLLPGAAWAEQRVVIETNYGAITVDLDDEKAPLTVANFLDYVYAGHYEGTIFHRVIKDFMIQGGNFSSDMNPKPTKAAVKNEAGNGLLNYRVTIAMARTGVVDSATSQFFINLKDNDFLDHKDESVRGFGYAVFGKVVSGMDVVDKIGVRATPSLGRFRDVPVEPVVISKVRRLSAKE